MSFLDDDFANTLDENLNMKVSDIMTSPVVVTQKDRTIGHVKEVLDRKHINAIPVLSMQGEIEGIISATDVFNETDNKKKVENIMTTRTYVVGISSGISDAAKMMLKHQVHHLVVMDDGQVVGIVSSMDFVAVVANG